MWKYTSQKQNIGIWADHSEWSLEIITKYSYVLIFLYLNLKH